MGLLYARCIGSLSANGKYIIPMDSDDMFLDKDVFCVLLNIAIRGNFDIIIYNSISTNLKPDIYNTLIRPTRFDRNHRPNRVLFQPDLGYYPTSPGDKIDQIRLNDGLIHGKFFKTKIYKIALNKLGLERYSRYMIAGEDNIVVNCIFNIARYAKFLSYYGYIYVRNSESVSKKQNKKFPKARVHLYILDPLIDFAFDSKRNKKVLVNYILYIFKFKYLKYFLNKSKYDNKVFNTCIDRILKCKLISTKYKNKIIKKGKKLGFIRYNLNN